VSEEAAVAWLRQVIEGDKIAAMALASGGTGHWVASRNDDFDYTVHYHDGTAPEDPMADTWREDVGAHIALHDPQDVIADCEAKLAILDEHQAGSWVHEIPAEPPEPPPWQRCTAGDGRTPCKTVRLLASSFRHHPGFAEHWGETAKA
jgi:hypothetical protein